jgi:hypothetical protein
MLEMTSLTTRWAGNGVEGWKPEICGGCSLQHSVLTAAVGSRQGGWVLTACGGEDAGLGPWVVCVSAGWGQRQLAGRGRSSWGGLLANHAGSLSTGLPHGAGASHRVAASRSCC